MITCRLCGARASCRCAFESDDVCKICAHGQNAVPLDIQMELQPQTSKFSLPCAQLLIPRVFHFVWVGPEPLPDEDARLMAPWLDLHPDWQAVVWSEHPERVAPVLDRLFPKAKAGPLPDMVNRWAFDTIHEWVGERARYSAQSDIVRAEVVRAFGGIYLDTDVRALRPIEPLLGNVRLCLAEEHRENKLGGTSSFMFGGVANHPALWSLLRWLGGTLYEDRQRIEAERAANSGSYTFLNPVDCPGPNFITKHLLAHPDCAVFPQRVGNPLHPFENPSQVTRWPSESFFNHDYAGKWYERAKRAPAPEFIAEVK